MDRRRLLGKSTPGTLVSAYNTESEIEPQTPRSMMPLPPIGPDGKQKWNDSLDFEALMKKLHTVDELKVIDGLENEPLKKQKKYANFFTLEKN